MNQKKEYMDVHVNGLKFHVQTFGSGVPIIMIMGLGAPGDKWKHNYELLSKWFWCIVPDNRGAGLSDKPEAESYTTEQMADDIIGIMDALDIKKAHVMGVSMGGAIAQQVALKVPDRVLSLILTSTFASVSPAFKKALNLICELKEDTDPAVLKQLNLWMTYGQYTQIHHPEKIEKSIEEDASYPYPMPVYAYKAQCGACLSHNTAGRLHELKMPVLIAAGAKDLFMNIEKTMELVHGISQAEFYLAPEGGHVHQWEYPEPYDSVVVGFLMKHTEETK
ncbi:alpha/beta fold hydrolase [Dorea formicigenerans]|uniref:alpha/beta fold hydrolase n=1 Tax=Dorea formicigenerans TaxID=39486 RepID=UPI00157009C3|nr:alpha/beta hydrolase [Dorea formicigenerans]NSK21136.1 alpha/beta hydrolase [Dorea formicigenerans]